EPEPEPELVMPEAVPNEFGTPQDEDWDFEDSDLSGLEEVQAEADNSDEMGLNELDQELAADLAETSPEVEVPVSEEVAPDEPESIEL
ncbi:hypothetical protein, partial [Vibrio nigripulchritudo]|uniref:hypothetical protein n=1 Tax=Vibrio nigripulchritudo TaxID=28173 RepID=UPI0005FA72DC